MANIGKSNVYDFMSEGIYYSILASGANPTCEVVYRDRVDDWTFSSPYAGEMFIPSTVSNLGKTYTVTSIGESAFHGCNQLVAVTLPDTITNISDHAFHGCGSLMSIILPQAVKSIGEFAFEGCSALTNVILGSMLTTISSHAFYGCSSLKSINIPNRVAAIGKAAFAYCLSLSKVTIGNNVTSIGFGIFSDCIELKNLTIGSRVTQMGSVCLSNCISLEEIVCLAPTPPRISPDTFNGVDMASCTLKVLEPSKQKYDEDPNWNTFGNSEAISAHVEKCCATPTLSIENGKLIVKTATEGAVCTTTITPEDVKIEEGLAPINLSGTYRISCYAHAPGYQNSDVVTTVLRWNNPTIEEG